MTTKQSSSGKQANSHRTERKAKRRNIALGQRDTALNKETQRLLDERKAVSGDPAAVAKIDKKLKKLAIKQAKLDRLTKGNRKN